MRLWNARIAAGFVAVALGLTACGGSPTGSGGSANQGPSEAENYFGEIAALSGDARRERLVADAEEEGQLNLYTSMTSDVADAVTEAFMDEFDVDVSVYRAGSETVLQRILQEAGANFAGADIVETNALELFAVDNESLLAEYQGDQRDKVSDAGRFDNWTATRYNLFSPSWNTSIIQKSDVPTSWEDLADPKYDGQLAMELSDVDWYASLHNYWVDQGKSQEEIDQLFSDMATGAKVIKGHTVMGELLSAGQFGVAASNYTYLVNQVKKKGAPVDYKPLVSPVIVRPNGFGLMKNAQNSAAAMLFADWMLDEGQQVLVDLGLTPSVPPPGSPDELEGVEAIPVDLDALLEDSEGWNEKYEKLLENGEAVEE